MLLLKHPESWRGRVLLVATEKHGKREKGFEMLWEPQSFRPFLPPSLTSRLQKVSENIDWQPKTLQMF